MIGTLAIVEGQIGVEIVTQLRYRLVDLLAEPPAANLLLESQHSDPSQRHPSIFLNVLGYSHPFPAAAHHPTPQTNSGTHTPTHSESIT
jgi:hypothetical protein